ncbi:MAG: proline dehydrogenase family protein [Candidatus Poseidoniales archaeon]
MVGLFSRMVVAMTVRSPRWFVGWVSRRYVAGSSLEDAIKVMKRLQSEGACFTIDVLGEEISSMAETDYFLKEYKAVISAIVSNELDANLSIKPTAFGILLDQKESIDKIESLVRMAAEHNLFVRLDMEDNRATDVTIEVLKELHERGLTNVGIVLQGRLFRTFDDIKTITKMLGQNADYRICKGIYLEPSDIAHTDRTPIIDATNLCLDAMLDAGAYVGIASHDYPVIDHALKTLKQRSMGPEAIDPRENACDQREGKGPGYEFQMLLGVRGPLRRKLRAKGHRTRVYIPYGKQWYEYSIRRLKENPTIGTQVAKAFLMPWSNRP